MRLGIDYRQDVFVVEDLLHDAKRTAKLTARQAADLWRRALAAEPARGHGLALYMHFPYCRSRCLYCINPSEPVGDARRARRYLEDSRREIEFLAPSFEGRSFDLWGVGGGTPSLLDAEGLRRWLEPAARRFSFAGRAMRTIEFNPLSTDRAKLKAARSLGFDRVSFGVQSLNTRVLRSVNRGYQDPAMVDRAIRWARDLGFETVNADLIMGLVGESASSFLEGFRSLARSRPTMITVYCLDWLAPYSRATGWSAEAYARHQERLLPEILEKLPRLAAQAGYRVEGFWPQKAWYFAAPGHQVRLGDDDGTASTLGLGWHSGSHVFGSALYVREASEFDPDRPLYNRSALSLKEEMGRYILYQLELRPRLDYAKFRRCFGIDPGDAFPVEIAALRRAGKVRTDPDGLDFLPQGSAERVFYISFFFLDTISALAEGAHAPS
ncbi:MAG: radical SAM protein [Elusimicrobia bacterium]|nr:radical SAM protein [Elusimicrobiota bacterium]